MKQRCHFFYKIGNFFFVFFLLQIQFAIKGSNAVPGNSHPNSSLQPISKRPQEPSLQSTDVEEVTNFEQFALNASQQNDLTQDLMAQDTNENSSLDDQNLKVENDEIALSHVFPRRPVPVDIFDSILSSADVLGLPMLESSYPLRPKTVSRQSNSANSGEQTPGNDFELIDENSVLSGSSRLAEMLYKKDKLINQSELIPLKFDELCDFLEANENVDMLEPELILICRRIIIQSENYVKALKDLPLFIGTHFDNKNAIKVNSILYSYLSRSGKEILGSDDDSASSRCSRRGTDSTIESSSGSSGINSPDNTSPSLGKNDEYDDYKEEHGNMRVLDEFNLAQTSNPHETQLSFMHLKLHARRAFLDSSAFSGSFRLAEMLYKNDKLINESELVPLKFDELCDYLEANENVDMLEPELILICRRIIIQPEAYVKALKDLPLFIETHFDNKNAVKVNSILYSYLSRSGKEILGSDDDSANSKCSRHDTDSTIESSPGSSGVNSPGNTSSSLGKKDEYDYYTEERGNMRVLDEINLAQANVPHVAQLSLMNQNLLARGAFLDSRRIVMIGGRSFAAPKWYPLYPLIEEVNQVISDDDIDRPKIEEID